RRRRRWGDLGLELLVAMVGIGAIAAGFLGFGLNEPTLDKHSAEGLSRATPSALAAVEPLFTLAVLEDPQGQPASLAILVPERDRSGGDIIFVPLGIMAEVASFGLRPLREVPSLGKDNLLAETVANMLGLNFDGVDVVTSDELTDIVTPLGVLSVELPTSVEVPRASSARSGNRRSVLRLGPGPTDVNPGDLATLFAGVAGESELDRIVRHQAIWEALLGRAARDLPAGADQAGGFSSAVGALAAGETSFHVLPVESISGGTDGSDELFRLRRTEAEELLNRIGGPTATNRITVQLLNGTGTPGLAQYVVPLLTPAGAQVTLTGNASRFDHETTLVVYGDPEDRAAAEAMRKALDVGEVVRSRGSVMLVDVMVVMGRDLAGRMSTGKPAA
ncbi:MAG: LytR C-terminal domain-containing protein, partial [Actinobacteria bacterium]|nr:LytR C-terminal domain-containing protein [Actinomycetota bacterium]